MNHLVHPEQQQPQEPPPPSSQQQQQQPHLRLRRVKSTSRAEEIVTEDEKQRRAQPDKPIHKPKDSLLSWTSGFQNYEGVMNWAFLLLTLGGLRLFLENLNKYGIRVDPTLWIKALFGNFSDPEGELPTLHLLLFLNILVVLTLGVEKALSKEWLYRPFWYCIHGMNLASLLIVPVVVINVKHRYIGPANATIICSMYSILFLKMWSYVQVNYWCRNHTMHVERKFGDRRIKSPSLAEFPRGKSSSPQKRSDRRGQSTIVHYPDNLSLGDLYYFWLAPTLCYELNFPKMERTRKLFLLRRAMEVIIGTNIALGLIQQWIIPSAVNSLIPFSTMDISHATERLLKLAVPNHLIWLTWFYLLFHSFLNTMGEILRFADREFYHDWWNSNNILTFWKTWNLPVHRWCVRHLFKPILRGNHSVYTAQIIVFLFSALLHEYLVSVPLRVFKVYAFMGMVMQVPLIFISQWAEERVGPRAGNIIVWISLIIGQPLAIMMYYHDYVVEHYGPELISYYGQLAYTNTSHLAAAHANSTHL